MQSYWRKKERELNEIRKNYIKKEKKNRNQKQSLEEEKKKKEKICYRKKDQSF